MGWTSVFDLVGNFATGHSQFDFLNSHSIVEHPISPCPVDGHNPVFAGLNHRSRTDQMRRVHRHRVSSGILNHPTREIDGDLSDVGDYFYMFWHSDFSLVLTPASPVVGVIFQCVGAISTLFPHYFLITLMSFPILGGLILADSY